MKLFKTFLFDSFRNESISNIVIKSSSTNTKIITSLNFTHSIIWISDIDNTEIILLCCSIVILQLSESISSMNFYSKVLIIDFNICI